MSEKEKVIQSIFEEGYRACVDRLHAEDISEEEHRLIIDSAWMESNSRKLMPEEQTCLNCKWKPKFVARRGAEAGACQYPLEDAKRPSCFHFTRTPIDKGRPHKDCSCWKPEYSESSE